MILGHCEDIFAIKFSSVWSPAGCCTKSSCISVHLRSPQDRKCRSFSQGIHYERHIYFSCDILKLVSIPSHKTTLDCYYYCIVRPLILGCTVLISSWSQPEAQWTFPGLALMSSMWHSQSCHFELQVSDEPLKDNTHISRSYKYHSNKVRVGGENISIWSDLHTKKSKCIIKPVQKQWCYLRFTLKLIYVLLFCTELNPFNCSTLVGVKIENQGLIS